VPSTNHAGRGRLISIEGLNGVGKTYLTARVVDATAARGQPPLVVEEFSRRSDSGSDLGRRLLRILLTAAQGEPFLRAGFPKSETLLVLAIKMHDFETTLPALLTGRTVIEGRSIHSTAVYQALIMNPDDDAAAQTMAGQILDTAARWRPLPDLTIIITDDTETSIKRAETRDGISYTAEQRRLHHRAAALFEHLAGTEPEHVRVLDRRERDVDELVATITAWIESAPARPIHRYAPALL
jgi:dTMP kinase